ncbi:hypothetical protein GCM10010532_109090 [Dactylosporangium siamense]|uniref:Uncharacterized protein n=1 Tax=Dactylosporangium siamense TaxID=685454 RepID=A0A919Q1Q5_9ACTN|nr:hypothetical protein Dsi01nite_103060 [Dactylosporangium siamense]
MGPVPPSRRRRSRRLASAPIRAGLWATTVSGVANVAALERLDFTAEEVARVDALTARWLTP